MTEIELIREALKDWGAGFLSDWVFIFIVHMIVNKEKELSPGAEEWCKKLIYGDKK